MSAVKLRAVRLLLAVLYSVTGAVVNTTEYSSVGGSVTLPCTQVPHLNCSSATWLFSQDCTTTRAVFEHGTIKESKDRLSVDSACSLHIANLSVEDSGGYTCRKFVNGQQHGADTLVNLCVLSVSKVAQPTADKTLMLECALHRCGGRARCSIENRMRLRWMDGTGTEIQNDIRYQEQKSSDNSILTVKLKWADNNPKRICQLLNGSEVKASHSYADDEGSGWPDEEAAGLITGIATGVAVLVALLVALIVVVTCSRRTASEHSEASKSTTLPSHEYETVNEKTADAPVYWEVMTERTGDGSRIRTEYAIIGAQPHTVSDFTQ